jgi:hypothetical protein
MNNNKMANICCNKIFKTRNSFNQHKVLQHQDKNIACSQCDKHFSTTHALTNHVYNYINRAHSWAYSGVRGRVRANVHVCNCKLCVKQRHIKRFQCRLCTTVWRSYAMRKAHEKSHSKTGTSVLKVILTFQCDLCKHVCIDLNVLA